MFTITEQEPRGIARERSQRLGTVACTASLPEKEHELWLPSGKGWGRAPFRAVRSATAKCMEPASALKECHGSNQGSLTRPASFLKCRPVEDLARKGWV